MNWWLMLPNLMMSRSLEKNVMLFLEKAKVQGTIRNIQ